MKNITTHILSTEECYTLNERLLGVFKTHLAKESVISDVLPYLTDINRDLSAILSRNNSNNLLTQQLAAKDQLRGAAFTGFRDYCKVFIKVKDPAKSEAAKQLVELIQKVGWTLQSQGYAKHTASQKALSEALEKPKYAQAVMTLDAESWVTDLATTNTAFEAVVNLKIESVAGNPVPSFLDCKRRMINYLKPLLHYLKLMARIKPDTYKQAMVKIEEEIEYISARAKARRTRKIKKSEE